MIRKLLFHRTVIPGLERGLDAMALRQKAVADNLANAQTPGYKRKVVHFEDRLHDAVNRHSRERLFRTDPEHLPGLPTAIRISPPELALADERRDGPGAEQVVLEEEMSTMAQTQLKFEAEVKLTQIQFEMLKMAIRGSR